MTKPVIVWFRRDLRLQHNPALQWACSHAEKILPVYIYSPDEEAPWQPGGASRWWLEQSLRKLEAELKEYGMVMHYFAGNSIEVLAELTTQTGATAITFNKLYEPHLQPRDAAVIKKMHASNIEVKCFDSGLFFLPGTLLNKQNLPYRVYTPFSKKLRSELNHKDITVLNYTGEKQARTSFALDNSKSLDDLEINTGHNWFEKLQQYWQPGEQSALNRIDNFIENSLVDYDKLRDIPSVDGTSALSAHLHFGEITVEQIYRQLQPALHAQFGEKSRQSAERYLNQLIWREFAQHILWHFPHTASTPMDQRYNNSFWNNSVNEFKQWTQGRTGIPIIDAGMKQLWETGWMHNRVRMITASFLTKNLGHNWLDGAHWFWDTLIDANLANNSMGWQWVAGCGVDAAPYYRIFNPHTQTKRFDTQGMYITRWAPQAEQSDYPSPMIDLDASRKHALQQYKNFISTQQD